jgi:hypothetical protein
MTAIEQAIKEAVKNGWRQPEPCDLEGIPVYHKGDAFLDPSFWQALGKAKGWNFASSHNYPDWQLQWHRFIDRLAEEKDAESFFSSLN